MTNLTRYNNPELAKWMNDVQYYTIGLDEWFNRLSSKHYTESNYPVYNIVKERGGANYRLEVALAGFKKEEITVETVDGKLYVIGKVEKDEGVEYVHRGLSKRSFNRSWTLADDVEITSVDFSEGLLVVNFQRIIPEHQKLKTWL
jgi:HSP20 family molecular chaperone IbpA